MKRFAIMVMLCSLWAGPVHAQWLYYPPDNGHSTIQLPPQPNWFDQQAEQMRENNARQQQYLQQQQDQWWANQRNQDIINQMRQNQWSH